jgi:hypothetical protein
MMKRYKLMEEPRKQYAVQVMTPDGLKQVNKTAVSKWHAIEMVYQDMQDEQPDRSKYKSKGDIRA